MSLRKADQSSDSGKLASSPPHGGSPLVSYKGVSGDRRFEVPIKNIGICEKQDRAEVEGFGGARDAIRRF